MDARKRFVRFCIIILAGYLNPGLGQSRLSYIWSQNLWGRSQEAGWRPSLRESGIFFRYYWPLFLRFNPQPNLLDLLEQVNARAFLELVASSGVSDTLAKTDGPLTIFAPSNEAFARLSKEELTELVTNKNAARDLIRFHMTPAFVFSQLFKNNLQLRSLTGVDLRINVYQGGKVFTASGATLSSKNQLASNGIVHVIDDVILPVPRDTVLQAARDHPDLTRLAEEFTSLNLTRALDGRSPITVFAPTDAAFEKIPKRIQDRLLKNIPTMTHILQQHIVPGVVYRAGLTNGDPVKTVTGGIHFITKTDKSLMIGGANIIRADISTRNGVLHLIDRILLPDDTEFETKAALPPGVPLPP